jgi:two-component system phosphate regulon sensor histidine kinase PhoR
MTSRQSQSELFSSSAAKGLCAVQSTTVMPLRDWLKPPKNLLLGLLLLTFISVSSLGWFGWRLLQQEQVIEAHRSQDRLQQAAGRIAAALQRALAETDDRVNTWANESPADGSPDQGLLLVMRDDKLSAFPPGRLLYWPSPPPEKDADPDAFEQGEDLEFQLGQLSQAVDWYRQVANSNHVDASIRAGALMRLARALRKLGRNGESRKAYASLALMRGVIVAGVPAELLARHELCDLTGRDAEALRRDLLQGRWRLTGGQFGFYWSDVSRLAGGQEEPPAEGIGLAEAAAAIWKQMKREPRAHGESSVSVNGKEFLIFWHGELAHRVVLLTPPESILSKAPIIEDVSYAIADGDGRLLAGKEQQVRHATVRVLVGPFPWTVQVSDLHAWPDVAMRSRSQFLRVAIGIMLLFLVLGTYFIARAIRREIEVSHLQADFVSAVSHEFRSPLTSMRQLSEVLAEGRVPSDERRQTYYETLVRETTRLQRLVETLLDFGRMDAGGRRYRFETLEAASLAKRVMQEFERHPATAGRQIELKGSSQGCAMEADPEALFVALRNLVDNAIQYSPPDTVVQLEWAGDNGHVAIHVRDEGAGIVPAERKAIFEKFVRGTAASDNNVKGMGLGLAMVREIVLAHGGEIKVTSEIGKGSTFTLLLPRVKKDDTNSGCGR